MKLNLASMALALPRARHPNRALFRGLLTLVDSPSDRPPAGARGHRVLLTRAAAERALPSLLGMGLDFTASFDGHDVRRKVGIITAVDISHLGSGPAPRPGRSRAAGAPPPRPLAGESVPAAIVISGFLFARDFPDVIREIRLGSAALGMSYEITDARVRDLRDRIWILDEVTFTGAAILRRDKAAYSQTSLELMQYPATSSITPQEKNMTPELTQQFVETSSRLAAAAESLEQALGHLDSERQSLTSKIERIIAAVEENPEPRRVSQLEARIAELERANTELKASLKEGASRSAARKTLPPLVTALLAKNGFDPGERVDVPTLDKALAPLSVEQRVAVKAQMARAGIID